MEIGNTENYRIGNSMDEFMEWMEKIKADLYFHNLKFDGEYVISWLEHNGYKYSDEPLPKTYKSVISRMGQWYMIDICYGYTKPKKGKPKKLHTVIYDSLKKLPFTVKKIAQDFKMTILKGDINYHTERPIGHIITPEEHLYIKHDIEIVANALHIQFEQGLTKMTNGSDSLSGFKDSISKSKFEALFPVFNEKLDNNIRLAYRGGFTWLNEDHQDKEIGEGLIFDVNSLYPSRMYDCDLPYGMPIPYEGKYQTDEDYPLWIQHIRCKFDLKEGHIPTIQIKNSMGRFKDNVYLKTSDDEIVDLYVSSVDWQLINDHYIVKNEEYCNGYKFQKLNGIFKDFIDYWTHIKVTSTGAIKLLAKLQLNSLYGKFASNPDVTGKVPFLKEDGSIGFKIPKDENGKIIRQTKDPIYTPMGIFITSWARDMTIRTAQKCYDRIIYCDTDSIHLIDTEIPEVIADIIDDNKLGYWAHESTFKRGKYLRQKTYVNELYTNKEKTETVVKVKCAGMPDKIKDKLTRKVYKKESKRFKKPVNYIIGNMPKHVKDNLTFKQFKVGYTSYGKLLPKHVKGGVVLIDTEFTIK